MLIGAVSDSHGRAAITARAVELLREGGADVLVHLGDIGTVEVLETLAGGDARVVLGNCDPPGLADEARRLGLAVEHPLGVLEDAGRRVAFTHGHLPGPMRRALEEGVTCLLHGHTHAVRDERVGPTRVINPGALCRARRYTCALLDPTRDEVRWIDVPRPPAPPHD